MHNKVPFLLSFIFFYVLVGNFQTHTISHYKTAESQLHYVLLTYSAYPHERYRLAQHATHFNDPGMMED